MARARKKAKKKPAHKAAEAPAHRGGGGTRPSWQGHLRLSLVSCPVALYNATTHKSDVSFHLLNPETNNRIRMIPTDPDTGPVERSDLVKGYEVSKNEYVVLTDEEINAVKLETTRTIDIERFVEADSIDRLYWNDPYFLVPDGEEGAEAYGVIRDAMQAAGRIALGRVVMHTRERLLGIEPRDNGLVAYTLRTENEVVDSAKLFHDIPKSKPDRKMIEIAEKIIEQKEGPFDTSTFKDRYEGALRELVKRKQKGQKPVTAAPPEDTNVIDLMEALKKSLKGKSHAHRAPANENKKRARR
ncbi:MAG TPA: Ku protein [Rhizomicrobium sp.]|jgi:DNA end-binding protein Ku|nr:Ku protein [Rhizomicrobium sp.]